MAKINEELVELKTNFFNMDKRLTVLETDVKGLIPEIFEIKSDLKHLIVSLGSQVNVNNERLSSVEENYKDMDKRLENIGVKIGGVLTVATMFISWAFNKIKW